MMSDNMRSCCKSQVGSPHEQGCENAWHQPTLPGMEYEKPTLTERLATNTQPIHPSSPLHPDRVAERQREQHDPIDWVNHPPHYTAGPVHSRCGAVIECIEVVREHSFDVGNVIKYLWRAGNKGDRLQDMKKAAWYLNDAIVQLELEQERARG